MYRHIIVPLDGSGRSHAALPVAASLARASGATLELARVHLNERPDLADDPSWDQMFMEGEQRYLESLALAYESLAGSGVRTSLLAGPVVKALSELAGNRVAPLFVMAVRGRTGLRRALLGSTSDGLVRHGSAPVLVLRDHPEDGDEPVWRNRERLFTRIIVPLDGSAYAEGGIAHAVAIARACDAPLRLVRVIGPVMTSAIVGAFAMHPLQPYEAVTVLRNDLAQEYLQGIVDRINAGGPKLNIVTEVSLSEDPATAIIESSRRAAADLIVMATHGRGASRLLRGAVGDRVLRDGPDAILFVKPAAGRLPAGLHTDQQDEPARTPAALL
jgi:nucleotide-binding universal stress UspA family protein